MTSKISVTDKEHLTKGDDKIHYSSPSMGDPRFSIDVDLGTGMSKQLLQESETVELKKSLAELLRLVHMVEAWGRGVPLILKKEPGVQFREIAKLFITSFDRPSFGESIDKAVVTTQETTQEKIIACLKAEPTLTGKLLAQRVGISESGVKYHLNKLKAAEKIRHVGPTKAGRWEVTDGHFGAPASRGNGGGHECAEMYGVETRVLKQAVRKKIENHLNRGGHQWQTKKQTWQGRGSATMTT